jgi:hypothetical protein
MQTTKPLWSSYDRIWFSGPDKQEILTKPLSKLIHVFVLQVKLAFVGLLRASFAFDQLILVVTFALAARGLHSPLFLVGSGSPR